MSLIYSQKNSTHVIENQFQIFKKIGFDAIVNLTILLHLFPIDLQNIVFIIKIMDIIIYKYLIFKKFS